MKTIQVVNRKNPMFLVFQMFQKNKIRPKADYCSLSVSEVYKMSQLSVPETLVFRW